MKKIASCCLLFMALSAGVRAQTKTANSPEQATPITIGKQYTIKSAVLAEDRIINVYLPPGYNKQDAAKYPVIYLLDGGLDEDFLHVAGLLQFNSQSWVGRTPKSIIIGIANTDRERDMTFPATVKGYVERHPTTGGSSHFMRFIETELMPFVKKHFNCSNTKTIVGESLAGLLATEILLKKPTMFDKYIIISPSLWWDNGSLLKYKVATGYKSATEVFIGVGKEGLAPSEEPHVMEVDANLLKEKLDNVKGHRYSAYLDYLPEENHATIAHQALMNALKYMSHKK
jgi:uncharacterized protein